MSRDVDPDNSSSALLDSLQDANQAKTDTIRDLRAQLQQRDAEVASLRVVLEQHSLQQDNFNRDLLSLDQSGIPPPRSNAPASSQDVESSSNLSPRDKQGLFSSPVVNVN